MKITVKYFASLREQMGKTEEVLTVREVISMAELWKNISGKTNAENILMAINMEYVQFDAIVQEGDEVAFFPPVSGG